MKIFKPLDIDAAESEEYKSILKEVDVLKKLSFKSDYVINYLDSFTTKSDEFIFHYLVTDLYEVNLIKYHIQISY